MRKPKYDLTGQKFGKLTVVKDSGERTKKGTMWLCKCDCGKFKLYSTGELRGGMIKSCGCIKESHKKELIGKKFGRLTVESLAESKIRGGRKVTAFNCVCDCGNKIVAVRSDLLHGNVKSCGCYKKDAIKKALQYHNPFIIDGDIVRMYTRKGEEFLISFRDLDRVKQFCWHINDHGYVQSNSTQRTIKLHNFILGTDTDLYYGDHIDYNRLNNTRENLRIVTPSQNRMNCSMRKDNPTGYTGVFISGNKFGARISKDHKNITIGTYDTLEEAVEARHKAELEMYGEYNNKDRDALYEMLMKCQT